MRPARAGPAPIPPASLVDGVRPWRTRKGATNAWTDPRGHRGGRRGAVRGRVLEQLDRLDELGGDRPPVERPLGHRLGEPEPAGGGVPGAPAGPEPDPAARHVVQ